MTFPSEIKFQDSLTDYLKRIGCGYCKFHDEFTEGIPDLLVRDLGFVELKMYETRHEVAFAQVAFAKRFHLRPAPVYLLFPDGSTYTLSKVSHGKPNKAWVAANRDFLIPTPSVFIPYFDRITRTNKNGR